MQPRYCRRTTQHLSWLPAKYPVQRKNSSKCSIIVIVRMKGPEKATPWQRPGSGRRVEEFLAIAPSAMHIYVHESGENWSPGSTPLISPRSTRLISPKSSDPKVGLISGDYCIILTFRAVIFTKK